MTPATAPSSIVSAEPAFTVKHVGPGTAEPDLTLPATRLPAEARGVAIGVLVSAAAYVLTPWLWRWIGD